MKEEGGGGGEKEEEEEEEAEVEAATTTDRERVANTERNRRTAKLVFLISLRNCAN
jgi:hypothetical protein